MEIDSELPKGYHLFFFCIPEFKLEASDDFYRVPRCSGDVFQFRHMIPGFLQTVKGYSRIDMVYMVVADISREPLHHGVHHHEAGRRQRSIRVGPVVILFEFCSRKIMLAIKKV
jgi:hypothetical protein